MNDDYETMRNVKNGGAEVVAGTQGNKSRV